MNIFLNTNFLIIAIISLKINAELADLACPEICDCHYFRINWVTDCSENNLTTLPAGIHSNTYFLKLNDNKFYKVPQFDDNNKIRQLELADNNIKEISLDSFSNLKYLLELDLSNNNIMYIHPNAFRHSSGLITLDLENNPLEEVLSSWPLFYLKTLINLNLRNCSLKTLDKYLFSGTPALKFLDLSENPLITIEYNWSQIGLSNLLHLKLKKCQIKERNFNKEFISLDLKGLDELISLDISESNIEEISWDPIKLENVNLGKTTIKSYRGIPSENLYHLNLADTNSDIFSLWNNEFSSLEQLIYLDISKCLFNVTNDNLLNDFTNQSIFGASRLKVLILNENNFTECEQNFRQLLLNLEILEKLSLKNCQLEYLPKQIFKHLYSLKELDISHNLLQNTDIEEISYLTNLEHLDLSYLNLEKLTSSVFSKLINVKTLILTGNPLKILKANVFKDLIKLENLQINSCQLKTLNDTIFTENITYPNLAELSLSGNPLNIGLESEIPHQLSDLEILNLSDTNITDIHLDFFDNFKKIRKLNLSKNNLTSLKFLSKLPKLEILNLYKNNISVINFDVLKQHHYLMKLDLRENPWKCECNLFNLWQWFSQIKRNIGILIGASISDEGFRWKRGLYCQLDSEISLLKTISNKKLGDKIPWARYIKESTCTNNLNKIRNRRNANNIITEKFSHNSIINWFYIIELIVMIFLFMIISIIVVVIKLKKRLHFKNLKRITSIEIKESAGAKY